MYIYVCMAASIYLGPGSKEMDRGGGRGNNFLETAMCMFVYICIHIFMYAYVLCMAAKFSMAPQKNFLGGPRKFCVIDGIGCGFGVRVRVRVNFRPFLYARR